MKFNALLVSLLPSLLAVASPVLPLQNTADSQQLLAKAFNHYPGFSLDLSELRLVQLDDATEPIWITELDKIKIKSRGQKFFDMSVSVISYSCNALNCYLAARTLLTLGLPHRLACSQIPLV